MRADVAIPRVSFHLGTAMQCLLFSSTGIRCSITALPRSRAEALQLLETRDTPLDGDEFRFVVREDVTVAHGESYPVEIAGIGFRKYSDASWGLTEHAALPDEAISTNIAPCAEDVKFWLLQAIRLQRSQTLRPRWVTHSAGLSLMFFGGDDRELHVVLDVVLPPEENGPDGRFLLSRFWKCHGIAHGEACLPDVRLFHDALQAIRGLAFDIEVV